MTLTKLTTTGPQSLKQKNTKIQWKSWYWKQYKICLYQKLTVGTITFGLFYSELNIKEFILKHQQLSWGEFQLKWLRRFLSLFNVMQGNLTSSRYLSIKWSKFKSIKGSMNVISGLLDGIMSLVTNISTLNSSKLAQCWLPMDSSCNLFKIKDMKNLNYGQKKARNGSLLWNLKCLPFGLRKVKNICWELYLNRFKCLGTGLLR